MKPSLSPVLGLLCASCLGAGGARAATPAPDFRNLMPTSVSEAVLKLRDPFKPPALLRNEGALSTPETYSLDQLRVVAVMSGPDHYKALVTAKDGKSFFVTEKSKLGSHKGFVRKIDASGIVVTEQFVNVLGQDERADTAMRLAEEPEALSVRGDEGIAPIPDVLRVPINSVPRRSALAKPAEDVSGGGGYLK